MAVITFRYHGLPGLEPAPERVLECERCGEPMVGNESVFDVDLVGCMCVACYAELAGCKVDDAEEVAVGDTSCHVSAAVDWS